METNIYSSSPTGQFHTDGYMRDRNKNGGGLLLYVRDSKFWPFYVELNKTKKKLLLCC